MHTLMMIRVGAGTGTGTVEENELGHASFLRLDYHGVRYLDVSVFNTSLISGL
jgi:hypothetical protein